MSATWEDALDECEARIAAASAALDSGRGQPLEPFSAPQIDAPIPAALEERARACSERGNDLAERIGHELERIRGELRRLPKMPRAARESHFDAQA